MNLNHVFFFINLSCRCKEVNMTWPKTLFYIFFWLLTSKVKLRLTASRGHFQQRTFVNTKDQPCGNLTLQAKNGILFPKLFLSTVKILFWWSKKTFEIPGRRPRICKNFEFIRTIYSNSERFLVTECCFNPNNFFKF